MGLNPILLVHGHCLKFCFFALFIILVVSSHPYFKFCLEVHLLECLAALVQPKPAPCLAELPVGLIKS
jgi:hypothetical protein